MSDFRQLMLVGLTLLLLELGAKFQMQYPAGWPKKLMRKSNHFECFIFALLAKCH